MVELRNSNQLKSFLKKESERLDISIPNVYHTFVARSVLEKISKAKNEKILVKGSSAEIAYLGSLVRSITDVDLASLKGLDINREFIEDILLSDDGTGLRFQLNKAPYQTPTGIYKLSASANFDKMHQHIGIDFQTNYDRLIEPEIRTMPVIFEGDEPFDILVPSFEEYLAEKLCIIIESNKPDVLNTRVKDFYDIYQLHGGKYNYDKLTKYFGEMLLLRGKIGLDKASTLHLNQLFIREHKSLWEATREKYDFLDKEIDLEGAVYYTRGVIREQLQKQGQLAPQNEFIQYTKKRAL